MLTRQRWAVSGFLVMKGTQPCRNIPAPVELRGQLGSTNAHRAAARSNHQASCSPTALCCCEVIQHSHRKRGGDRMQCTMSEKCIQCWRFQITSCVWPYRQRLHEGLQWSDPHSPVLVWHVRNQARPSFLQTPSTLGLVRVTHQAPFLLHYLVMLFICLVPGESSNLFTGAIWPVLNFHFRKFKWMNKHKNEMVHELLNYHTIYYYVRCLWPDWNNKDLYQSMVGVKKIDTLVSIRELD